MLASFATGHDIPEWADGSEIPKFQGHLDRGGCQQFYDLATQHKGRNLSEPQGGGCVCVCVLVTQSCPTLCDPMDCILPSSCVHGDSPGKNAGVGCHCLLKKEDGEVKMVHLESLGRAVGCLPWENMSRRNSGLSEQSCR